MYPVGPNPRLVALGGVALAIAFYVLFGPEENKRKRIKRKKGEPVGLPNPGTACFVNAILQGMAASQHFTQWIRNVTNPGSNPGSVRESVYQVMRLVNAENGALESVSGCDVLKALRRHGWRISSQEQDAHEFFHVLLTSMEEELEAKMKTDNEKRNNISISQDDEEQTMENKQGVMSRLNSDLNLSKLKVKNPFSGTLANKVTKEKSDPVQAVTFNEVTLTLPENKGITAVFGPAQVELVSLIRRFTEKERVSDDITRQQSFGRLPKCLVFHIQRIQFENGVVNKRQDKVNFPFRLDMDEFVYANKILPEESGSKSSKFVYNLRAVLVHLGAVNSGHYVTYRKCGDNWFLVSDDNVTSVESKQVFSSVAYMLVYDKDG